MENSQAYKKVIDLGKAIVNELQLEPGVDTLARWMVHFIAEKIEQAETLDGEEKKSAEKECFEIILKLWEHRSSASRGNSFLSEFDSLFETLQKLDPSQRSPYFFPSRVQVLFDGDEVNKGEPNDSPENKSHFEMALEVDKLARSLISDLLSRGVSEIEMDEEKKRSIENAIDLIDYPDTRIIRFTTDYEKSLQGSGGEEENPKEERIRELQKRINDLEEFNFLKDALLERYKQLLVEASQ